MICRRTHRSGVRVWLGAIVTVAALTVMGPQALARAAARRLPTGSLRAMVASSDAQCSLPRSTDPDCDGLPTSWERSGYYGDGPGSKRVFVPLQAMGADPDHPDIFVHADYMRGLARNCRPPEGWEIPLETMFRRHGIRLHVDSGPHSLNYGGRPWGRLSRAGPIRFDPQTRVWRDLPRLKEQRFWGTGRRAAFRYAAFANHWEAGGGRLGAADSWTPPGGANFLMFVCRRGFTEDVGPLALSGTFAHELGHTLGLAHGGNDPINHKPNYLSVMNYLWQLTGVPTSNGRQWRLDYSETVRPPIDEEAIDETQLTEPAVWHCPGAATPTFAFSHFGRPVDVNCDGILGEQGFAQDINGDGLEEHALDTCPLTGFDDWTHLYIHAGGLPRAPRAPHNQIPYTDRQLDFAAGTPIVADETSPAHLLQYAREATAAQTAAIRAADADGH